MDYSAIPDELKAMPNWVCANRDSKVPMRAYELKAASASNLTPVDIGDSPIDSRIELSSLFGEITVELHLSISSSIIVILF